MLQLDVSLGAVSLIHGLARVEDVPGQEGEDAVTALHPDGQPGGEPRPLPLPAVGLHLPLPGEGEEFAQLVHLGRGQPQPGLVELVQEQGGLRPLQGRHLLPVLQARGEAVQPRLVEYRVEPPVSLLIEVGGSEPVRPLLESPEVRTDPQVLVELQQSPGVTLDLNT